MHLVTKTKFAQMAGISKPRVSQYIKEGRLCVVGEGRQQRIDLTHADTMAILDRSRENQKCSYVQKTEPVLKTASSQERKSGGAIDAIAERAEKESELLDVLLEFAANEEWLELLSEMPETIIKKLKIVQEIYQRKTKVASERGQLIDRDIVRTVLSELFAIDINQLKPLGDKIGSEVSAAFGMDDEASILRASEIVNSNVYAILSERQRVINDALEDIKTQKMDVEYES